MTNTHTPPPPPRRHPPPPNPKPNPEAMALALTLTITLNPWTRPYPITNNVGETLAYHFEHCHYTCTPP